MINLLFKIQVNGDDASCVIVERVEGETTRKETIVSEQIQALAENFLATLDEMSKAEKGTK